MRTCSHLFPLFLVVVVALLPVWGYTDPKACTDSAKFYDILTLQCTPCPINTVRASDFTFCNCTTSYYDNPDIFGFNNAQSCLTASGNYAAATQIVSIYDVDGTLNPTITTCSDSYPNSLNTKCIPCGPSMTYSTPLSSCQCSTAGEYYVVGACYRNTNAGWAPINPITNVADYLAEINAVIGCGQHNVYQACHQLMNKCVKNGYATTDFFCKLLATYQSTKTRANGLPVYSFASQIQDSISIYASSIIGTNTTTIKNTFQFILAEYNEDGSLNDLKSLDQSIFSCYLNSEDIVEFQSFGLNFWKTCSNPRTFSSTFFYDLYVVEAGGNYSQVPVEISGKYYKRFLPSVYNSIEVNLMSIPPLRVPFLALSNQNPALISTNSNALSTTLNYLPFLIIFAVFIFITLAIDFFRYMRYNPDENNDPFYCCYAIVLFLIHSVKFVAVGIWFWVFALATYCFCFYKFQQTVYLILPDPSADTSGLYTTFAAFFYITFSFTIVAILIIFFRIVNNTDYFLIDWEKEKDLGKFDIGRNRKEVSVWRKVLLVNEIYELSVHRLINIEMVSLLSLLFLSGLKWINLNSMVPALTDLITDSTVTTNPILSYFIITFCIFVIALMQFLLKHAIKTWYPLPIEDFVDLCSVSNLSIIIFDEALHGYYIHGVNPMGQSEGSLTYIQNMFEKEAKAFGKSRSFKLEDTEQCQTFEVVFPFEVRKAFQVKYKSRFNEKLAGKAYNTSILSNPIPDMLTDEDYFDLEEISNTMLETFKFYLEGIKTSNLNLRERNLIQKIFSCPVDTQTMGRLPIFFKDLWYEFNSVMVSGHEFILLFNFINFVNIFYIATQNVYFAFFISFIFQRIFTFIIGYFIKRNISRNTLIDDKFFN